MVFAGTIVVISLMGLLLMGFQFVWGIAIGSAAAVFVTMLASITLLPAMFGFVGRNIDRFGLPPEIVEAIASAPTAVSAE